MNRILEKLATINVGKPESTLSFVSINGDVRAVFDDREYAIFFAEKLGNDFRVLVENKDGEIYTNQAYDLFQDNNDTT